MQIIRKLYCLQYLTLFAGMTLSFSGGCLSRVPNTYGYSSGSYRTILSADMTLLWNAAIHALEEMNIPIQTQSKDDLVGIIDALTASNKRVRIELNRLTESSTQIMIHVGILGDRERTIKILSRIREAL